MSVEVLNPDGLPQPDLYRQVAVAHGSRLVFLAGQVGRDAHGDPVGTNDLAAQAEQALRNVDVALRAVGATFADVAKLTVYVVNWSPEMMPTLGEGVGRAIGDLDIDLLRPMTLIGVVSLGEPDLLIEIEATAVLD